MSLIWACKFGLNEWNSHHFSGFYWVEFFQVHSMQHEEISTMSCMHPILGSLTAIPLHALQLLHVVGVGCQATSSKPLRMQSDGWPYSKVSKYNYRVSSNASLHAGACIIYTDVTYIEHLYCSACCNVYIGYTSGFHTGFWVGGGAGW